MNKQLAVGNWRLADRNSQVKIATEDTLILSFPKLDLSLSRSINGVQQIENQFK
jgi:hypothetical protein